MRRPELDHVGIAVEDLGAVARMFIDGLGGTLIGGGLEPLSQTRSAHIAFPGGGKVELLQATGGGAIQEFIAAHGGGVHHLTILVADLPATIARLNQAGYRTIGEGTPTDSWHEAYVHPRDAGGCLIQLVRPGPNYGEPVDATLDQVLADEWEWVDRSPVRKVD